VHVGCVVSLFSSSIGPSKRSRFSRPPDLVYLKAQPPVKKLSTVDMEEWGKTRIPATRLGGKERRRRRRSSSIAIAIFSFSPFSPPLLFLSSTFVALSSPLPLARERKAHSCDNGVPVIPSGLSFLFTLARPLLSLSPPDGHASISSKTVSTRHCRGLSVLFPFSSSLPFSLFTFSFVSLFLRHGFHPDHPRPQEAACYCLKLSRERPGKFPSPFQSSSPSGSHRRLST
jgi:hypothetical protein